MRIQSPRFSAQVDFSYRHLTNGTGIMDVPASTVQSFLTELGRHPEFQQLTQQIPDDQLLIQAKRSTANPYDFGLWIRSPQTLMGSRVVGLDPVLCRLPAVRQTVIQEILSQIKEFWNWQQNKPLP